MGFKSKKHSNKLIGHTLGQTDYTYDDAGNMLSMPHLNVLTWNEDNILVETDLGGGGTAYYRYDSGGQRIRKVIVNGNVKKERLYINDFELWQQSSSGTVQTERETLNVRDDEKSFLQLETLTIENGNTVSTPVINWRYQYDNHLGSACLELDGNAAVISYEEYFPFGSSSYRSGKNQSEVKLKRYRYCGKERDEETGLYYYGARYYAAWIGRFISVDPLAEKFPQLTPYNYAGNKPITGKDLEGLQGTEDTPIREFEQDNTAVAKPKLKSEYIFKSTIPESVVQENKNGDNKLNLALIGLFAELYGQEYWSIGSKANIRINQSIHDNLTGYESGAITLGFDINFTKNYGDSSSKNERDWIELIAHEIVHVKQFIGYFGSDFKSQEDYKESVSDWIIAYGADAASTWLKNPSGSQAELHDTIFIEKEANKKETLFDNFLKAHDYKSKNGTEKNKVLDLLNKTAKAKKNKDVVSFRNSYNELINLAKKFKK